MSTAFILALVAFFLLAVFAYLAMRPSKDAGDVEQATSAIRSLDVEAFRNLVDLREEAFLRARLAPREFRRIQRERAQAALAYVKAVSQASLQFARLGGAAKRSPDPAIAASGRQIANSATYLRLRALEASVSLTVAAAFPWFGPRPLRSLLEQYDRASQLLQNHTGLERVRSQAL
jgi:hypothetical protein